MGCAVSTSPASVAPAEQYTVAESRAEPQSLPTNGQQLLPLGPGAALADEAQFCKTLLDALHEDRAQPRLPVRTHAARLSSGDRGISLACVRALREWYRARGALDKVMGDVCKEEGFGASVVAITRSTGLSLAESLVLTAGEREMGALVSRATSFFSYSWTGTKLGDMLDAVERTVAKLEAADGRRRFVWVDMFCASQTLLAGVFRDPAITKEADPAGYAARKEDTDRIFDDALDAVDELLLYCSPLTGEWQAPLHLFLLPERGSPPANWLRRGPGSISRAWCLFEVVKALAKGCTLHVVLSAEDVEGFETLLTEHFEQIASIVASVDARDAQITKTDDRAYILNQVAKLDGGLGAVTATVCARLREWLAAEGQAALARLPAAARGTSALINNLARLLQDMGELDAAEPLLREALQARRETLGDRHPGT